MARSGAIQLVIIQATARLPRLHQHIASRPIYYPNTGDTVPKSVLLNIIPSLDINRLVMLINYLRKRFCWHS